MSSPYPSLRSLRLRYLQALSTRFPHGFDTAPYPPAAPSGPFPLR